MTFDFFVFLGKVSGRGAKQVKAEDGTDKPGQATDNSKAVRAALRIARRSIHVVASAAEAVVVTGVVDARAFGRAR